MLRDQYGYFVKNPRGPYRARHNTSGVNVESTNIQWKGPSYSIYSYRNFFKRSFHTAITMVSLTTPHNKDQWTLQHLEYVRLANKISNNPPKVKYEDCSDKDCLDSLQKVNAWLSAGCKLDSSSAVCANAQPAKQQIIRIRPLLKCPKARKRRKAACIEAFVKLTLLYGLATIVLHVTDD